MRAALATVLLALELSSCTSTTVGSGAPINPPASARTVAPVPTSGPALGSWTGTITFHGVISINKTEPGHSDLDPSNTYYETWTTTTVTQLDATDTFTISSTDHGDLTYGITSVDLDGTAANSGTDTEQGVQLTNKHNSGCTWKQEDGSETTGSWSGSGKSVGTLQFSEDGSYYIDIRADANGEGAQLPHRDWLKYSDISASCSINYPPYDTQSMMGPAIEWVSSHQSDIDVNNMYPSIEGKLNASNPGPSVDGTSTWQMKVPEGFTMTITWHLVHSSPIVLPHA